ncbi:transposase, partial [Thermodesulfovibrionales bacterium]|nr:transposase [Thermodesulfovibrionales bacterium]
RVLSETQTYHIMLRGNNRQDVFIDDEDKARIIATISEKKGGGRFALYAYCVMDNHLHLVLKEGTDPLSRALKRIGTSYAYYFNKRYKRVGHVFQDRYRSENIEDDTYLLGAIRYIHQNPEKAGIGSQEAYPWSSYHEYFKEDTGLVAADEILSMFSNDREKAIDAFKKYHQEEAEGFFLDVEEKKRILEENVQSFTSQYLIKQKLELEGLKLPENKKFRDELIGLLREESDLSLRRIAEVLQINREVVRRAVAPLSKEPSP